MNGINTVFDSNEKSYEVIFEKVKSKKQLAICLDIIHKSFITVADEFGLTQVNCPSHTAFMPIDKLIRQFENQADMFLCCADGKYIGYFSLSNKDDKNIELNNLSVLPLYRHMGLGKKIIEYAKEYAAANTNTEKILIGLMEENTILKYWYQSLGFIHTGTKRYDSLPFTVGFMYLPLLKND